MQRWSKSFKASDKRETCRDEMLASCLFIYLFFLQFASMLLLFQLQLICWLNDQHEGRPSLILTFEPNHCAALRSFGFFLHRTRSIRREKLALLSFFLPVVFSHQSLLVRRNEAARRDVTVPRDLPILRSHAFLLMK